MSEKKTENASGATEPNVANPGCRCQCEEMKFRTLLRRWSGSLLGLVDEYWAMRRPWQYGTKDPQCELLEGTNLGHFGANFPSVFAPKTGPNGPKSCAVTQYRTLVYSG